MNVALPSTALSLFSGVGGLDFGLRMATGCRTVCYVEREAFAASVIVARMEESSLDAAPIWDDVSTFDGKPWRGVVDCVVGGSPCQGNSVAGKRLGLSDARSGLWKEMRRIVEECQPTFVFWENVGGAVSLALKTVEADLAALGYRTEACTVNASDVGAPHRRTRLFVLAYSDALRQPQPQRIVQEQRRWVGNSGKAMADAECEFIRKQPRRTGMEKGAGAPVASDYRHAWPPGRDDEKRWALWRGAQPRIRRGTDGVVTWLDRARNNRLRALGNGVVPQQAALAWTILYNRLQKERTS